MCMCVCGVCGCVSYGRTMQVPVHASLLELEMVSALRLPELQLDGSGGPLTAHCHIYTRHPSLHSGVVNLPDPQLISDPQLPQRTADAALTHWRNVCAKRGWRCRPGYQNMNELADWVVADILAAVDEHWPKRKLPPPCVTQPPPSRRPCTRHSRRTRGSPRCDRHALAILAAARGTPKLGPWHGARR